MTKDKELTEVQYSNMGKFYTSNSKITQEPSLTVFGYTGQVVELFIRKDNFN